MGDPESTTTGGSKWVRTVSTTGTGEEIGSVWAKPIPADGDNYAYTPPLIPPQWVPQIPPQWVPVTEYRELLRRVEVLERQVAALRGEE
jgi:hypothetical protein